MRLPVGPGSRPLHVVVSVHACGHCQVRPCGTAGDSVCRVHAHAQLPQLPPPTGPWSEQSVHEPAQHEERDG